MWARAPIRMALLPRMLKGAPAPGDLGKGASPI